MNIKLNLSNIIVIFSRSEEKKITHTADTHARTHTHAL